MLLLTVLAAVALSGALADQAVPSASAPATSYGPPAPQPYAAPAAAPELSELTDGSTYLQYPGAYSYNEPGFSVQTGYEGYLVPWTPEGHGVSAPSALAGLGLLSKLLPLPKLGIALFPKLSIFLLGFLFLLLIGGAFTTAVCAFTPICTISFLGLGLTRNTMRSYLTPDRLTQTTAFVLDAIDKYKDFSKKVSAKEARSKKDRRRR